METHSTSGVSVTSSVRRTTKYKKYGLKDYNNMKEVASKNRMGGLGANIGGENWEAAKRKKEIQQ
jgi:hypothetical protein